MSLSLYLSVIQSASTNNECVVPPQSISQVINLSIVDSNHATNHASASRLRVDRGPTHYSRAPSIIVVAARPRSHLSLLPLSHDGYGTHIKEEAYQAQRRATRVRCLHGLSAVAAERGGAVAAAAVALRGRQAQPRVPDADGDHLRAGAGDVALVLGAVVPR